MISNGQEDIFPSRNGARKCTIPREPYQGRCALLTRLLWYGLKKAPHCFDQKTGCFLAHENDELVSGRLRAFLPGATPQLHDCWKGEVSIVSTGVFPHAIDDVQQFAHHGN